MAKDKLTKSQMALAKRRLEPAVHKQYTKVVTWQGESTEHGPIAYEAWDFITEYSKITIVFFRYVGNAKYKHTDWRVVSLPMETIYALVALIHKDAK